MGWNDYDESLNWVEDDPQDDDEAMELLGEYIAIHCPELGRMLFEQEHGG